MKEKQRELDDLAQVQRQEEAETVSEDKKDDSIATKPDEPDFDAVTKEPTKPKDSSGTSGSTKPLVIDESVQSETPPKTPPEQEKQFKIPKTNTKGTTSPRPLSDEEREMVKKVALGTDAEKEG